MYHALRRQAGYFGVDGLVKWLKDKAYLQMVKMKYSVKEYTKEYKDLEPRREMSGYMYPHPPPRWTAGFKDRLTEKDVPDFVEGGDVEVQQFPSWHVKKVYPCLSEMSPRQDRARTGCCG